MSVEVKLRKWGNSIGLVLPKEYSKSQNLKENQTVRISVVKETDLSSMYGKLKGKINLSSQKFKDELRKEE
jgi:antitoxin component of MazEF toxin-antitoxin module